MKKQDELNQKNEYAKEIAAGLKAMLKANEKKLVDKALKARHGEITRVYGDTGYARCSRIAQDAVNDLVKAIEASVAQPQKQAISDKKLRQVEEKCQAAEGKLEYEVTVQGERVATFHADNQTDAAMFADSLKLGKHEVNRLTKEQRNAERNAFATSPESENYWSS